MSPRKLAGKLWLLALALTLGFGFAPPVHAQEDEEPGSALTAEQEKELRSINSAMKKCEEALRDKDYETGVKAYKKLCEKVDKTTIPDHVRAMGQTKYLAHYNYACCLSLTGAKDDAVKEFGRSVELGFFDWKHIASDTDLDPLREMDSFKKAVEDGKKLEVEKLAKQVKAGTSPVKDFEFEVEVGGKKKTLASYKGKVLVVALLITQQEDLLASQVALLQKASDELKGKDVEFLGIVFGAEEDNLKSIADEHKLKFDLAVGQPTESLKAAFGTGSRLFVIDKSGKVRGGVFSVHQEAVIPSAVKPLLEESGPAKDGEKKDGEKKDKKKEDF